MPQIAPCVNALLGLREQQTHRLGGHAMLGVVEVESLGLDGEALAAARILSEKRSQMNIANLPVMVRERFPGRALGEPRRFGIHRSVLPCRESARLLESGALLGD